MTRGDSGMREVNYVSLDDRRVHRAEISWRDGRIAAIKNFGAADPALGYLIPGFVDAHVHIESSMLPPAEFGRIALRHGTLAAVTDPHEIANVLGVEGVRFMLENARKTPFKAFSAHLPASRRPLSRPPTAPWIVPRSKRCCRSPRSAACRR
jgi:adenine deaminase